MPLGYFIESNGRAGAELRVARGRHELLATGPAARIGSLLPHLTTTTTLAPDGRPLEVRMPFLLALWLVLGCLVPAEDVLGLLVYEHIVGAERLGAAMDTMLAAFWTRLTSGWLLRRLFYGASYWSWEPSCEG